MKDSTGVLRTFKYRLFPSQSQDKNLLRVLHACHGLYNMVLAERKYAWEAEGRSVTQAELEALGKRYRQTFPFAQQMFSQTAQSVVKQVDRAFEMFFRRVKAGKAPGYPRFKPHQQFASFEFKQFGAGARLEGRRLKLYGIGRIVVRWHRPLEGTIKTVRIVYKSGRWYACFSVELDKTQSLPQTGSDTGIDVGVSALITTSDGDKVDNPNYYRTGQSRLKRLQRKLARAKRGSKNRRKALKAVQRQQEHIANQRHDFLHKLSTALIQSFDRIALEDLIVKNMVRNPRLSKSIFDSGWSMFRHYLTYKAESAGRVVAFVDPRYTSKTCSNCGAVFETLTLADRWVECACGLSLDRDHNAALNILKRAGWDTSVQPNAAPLPQPNGRGKRKRAVEAARL
ncbi:MAG TPA: transposase [Phototrophicaceae bacterium]|jgi:putative transposase|nr:transposase [Phototrophicaceae bacterium]